MGWCLFGSSFGRSIDVYGVSMTTRIKQTNKPTDRQTDVPPDDISRRRELEEEEEEEEEWRSIKPVPFNPTSSRVPFPRLLFVFFFLTFCFFLIFLLGYSRRPFVFSAHLFLLFSLRSLECCCCHSAIISLFLSTLFATRCHHTRSVTDPIRSTI